MTDQQKEILKAFENSFQNLNDEEKLAEVVEALEKAHRNEYLPHTIKTILVEVKFLTKKPHVITKAGIKYLKENSL